MRLRGLISGYPFCVTEGTRGMKEAYGTEEAGAVAQNLFCHTGHKSTFFATIIIRYRLVKNQWPKSGHGGQQVAKTLATSLSQNSNEKSVFAAVGGHHF